MSKQDIVFLDIEAEPSKNKILQFGAFKFTNKDIEEINIFANPNEKISNHVFKMIKANIENIKNGLSQKEVAIEIYNVLKDCYFASYGDFDFLFLKKFLKKEINYDLNESFFIDVQNEWKKICGSNYVWGLDKLAKHLNINVIENKFHDAFYDAKILFKVFYKINILKNDDLKKIICKKNILNEKIVSNKFNKKNKKAQTINNIDYINGECFLNIKFKKQTLFGIEKELLYSLDVLEIQNNKIKKNWSFFYNLKNIDFDEYQESLNNNLKKYLDSSKNKKIIIDECNFGKYIKLVNVCSEIKNIFPINKVLFSNCFENFYNKIQTLSFYQFEDNQTLIKNWLVYDSLINDKI